MSDYTDLIVRTCLAELELFRDGKNKEYDKSVYLRVGEYWDDLAKEDDYKSWKGYNGRTDTKLKLNKDGEVVDVISNHNQPWSAAFISWVSRAAGAGDDFSYAPSHSVYIVKALKAAENDTTDAKFIARRHTEYKPKIGDLIACERRKSDDATFDTYIDFVKAGRYEAHCDFVVDIQDDAVITVGGNVSHSVKQKEWPTNDKGLIGNRDPFSSTAGVICVIECLL